MRRWFGRRRRDAAPVSSPVSSGSYVVETTAGDLDESFIGQPVLVADPRFPMVVVGVVSDVEPVHGGDVVTHWLTSPVWCLHLVTERALVDVVVVYVGGVIAECAPDCRVLVAPTPTSLASP